jgi:hypothetical protein
VPIFVLAGSVVVLLFVGGWTLWLGRRAPGALLVRHERRAVSWPQTPWKNARPGVKYVGDAACTACHAEIAAKFRHHPMGRSLAPIASTTTAGGVDRSDGSTRFEADSSLFTIERRGGKEVHCETRLDRDGRLLARVEQEVKYALGSGTRGVSFLVEHDGRLFQSPISWYTQKKKWDLSPGYEDRNVHFNRPIESYCLFCHANRVDPVKLSVNRYKEPVFQGDAIGCERCHGPGELHIKRQEDVDGRDLTIVNPWHLSPSLRGAVCEQCHLLGDQRVNRLDHDAFDYRPGLPSIAFYAIYGRVNQTKNKAVGHVEQMKASRCFLASQGRLGCTSCHDPHQVPSARKKVAYFRGQCLACHDRNGCKLPDQERRALSKEDNCIQCHMPKHGDNDIVHTAATDHRIRRRPGAKTIEPDHDPAGLPLVLLNGDDLAPEERGSLGRELAISLASEGSRHTKAREARRMQTLILSLLDQALAERPDDLVAQRVKAQTLVLAGRRADAIKMMQAVVKSAPTYEQALDECLTYTIAEGNVQAALEPACKAVAANPFSASFRERLAYVLIEHGVWDGAFYQSREALRIDPFLMFARMFQVQCFLQQKNLERAQEELATLIKLHSSRSESLEKWFAEQRRIHKI